MEMFLYNVSDDNKVLNKTLEDVKHILNMKLKEPVDIISPSLILRNTGFLLYNYAYIPEFERYYFIENVTSKSKDVYEIQLKVDALMSFKDDILLSKGVITSDKIGNSYLDSDKESELRKDFNIYESDKVIELESSIIINIFGR